MNAVMTLFLVAVLGYMLGSIKIKGLQLGSSGVLIVALIFGHFGFEIPSLIRELGLALFVTAVGFIAGPIFFRNFKKKAMNYIILGFLIITIGSAVCILCMKLFDIPTPLGLGLMAGALTSTPALAASIEASGSDLASVGYGITYPFGVVGVVLFMQLIPKILKSDIHAEAQRMNQELMDAKQEKKRGKEYYPLDDFGFFPFSLAVVIGLLISSISLPLPGGASFSLGSSGGPLLVGLLLGHFGHIGPISVSAPSTTLRPLREFGLILFLMGAGTNAGKGFIAVLQEYGVVLFIVGIFITLAPMIVAYIVARGPMHMEMLNTLGSISGGMTSTPALGTLITVSRTDAVASSYAATYPVALIFIVLFSQFIAILI